jgi:hypothetical protein
MSGKPGSPDAVLLLALAARRLGVLESGLPETVTVEDIPALRALVEGTARSTGEEFFPTLVRHLAQALDVPYAFGESGKSVSVVMPLTAP